MNHDYMNHIEDEVVPARTPESHFVAYQRLAMKFAAYKQSNVPTGIAELYPFLGLAEEAGEVAGKVAKAIRKGVRVDTDAMAKELGDVLWMVAACCEELEISMSDVAADNIIKLADRKSRDVIVGEGDDR
jgi:NTP pyrophosphatase (non-canonical NTP hydrolase)